MVHLADQRRSRTDSHGIINFSVGLVQALPAALRDDERLVVLANEEIAGELGTSFLRAQDEIRTVPAPRSTLARLRIDHVTVRRAAAAVGADVVLYPKGMLPLVTGRSAARHVPCLHDDIPARARGDRSLPWRRRLRAAYFTFLLRRSMRTADRRLFVSGFSARQLAALADGPRADDVVVHEGITLPRRPVRPLAERHPQAVVLGSSHPHKRTAAGLELLGRVPDVGALIERVVVLGWLPPGATCGPLAIDHRPDPVAGETLAALLGDSRLLVYPSTYEGFGLPPIEAYALGTPAVYRSTEAAEEVLVDVPGAFTREDAAAFEAALREVVALDDAELGRLAASMWEQFDWARVAGRVAAALRDSGH
jgi:glycosyltransferase involved in cell wall biosynthesis